MRQGFEKAGLRFTSYRRLSEQTLSLSPASPANVALPGKTATLTLQPGEHPQAAGRRLRPAAADHGRAGADASAFLQAGPHDDGQLVLVLTAKK